MYESPLGYQNSVHGERASFSGYDLAKRHLRSQTQPFEEKRYRHTLDAVLTIYRTEGWRAFFRGLLPSLLGILHVGVQFPLYEQLKTVARESLVHVCQRHVLTSCRPGRHSSEDLTPKQFLACSAASKMVASITTYPHEVVRTRLQTQKRIVNNALRGEELPAHPRAGVIKTATDIVRHEGWRGLYRGLSVNLVRTVPNSAVTMLTCVHHSTVPLFCGPGLTASTQRRYEMLMRYLEGRSRGSS